MRILDLILIFFLVVVGLLKLVELKSRQQAPLMERMVTNRAEQRRRCERLLLQSKRYLGRITPAEAKVLETMESEPQKPAPMFQATALPNDWVSRLHALVDALQQTDEKWQHRWDALVNNLEEILQAPSVALVFDENQLHFETLSADLGNDATTQRTLQQILSDAEAYVRAGYNLIQIEGHADVRQITTSSRFKDNLALSIARAETVARRIIAHLEGKNFQQGRDFVVVPAGYGEHVPRLEGETEEAWAKNRRIEIVFFKRQLKKFNQ